MKRALRVWRVCEGVDGVKEGGEHKSTFRVCEACRSGVDDMRRVMVKVVATFLVNDLYQLEPRRRPLPYCSPSYKPSLWPLLYLEYDYGSISSMKLSHSGIFFHYFHYTPCVDPETHSDRL